MAKKTKGPSLNLNLIIVASIAFSLIVLIIYCVHSSYSVKEGNESSDLNKEELERLKTRLNKLKRLYRKKKKAVMKLANMIIDVTSKKLKVESVLGLEIIDDDDDDEPPHKPIIDDPRNVSDEEYKKNTTRNISDLDTDNIPEIKDGDYSDKRQHIQPLQGDLKNISDLDTDNRREIKDDYASEKQHITQTNYRWHGDSLRRFNDKYQ